MERYPGTLPDPGGLLDQNQTLMHQIEIVADEVRTYEQKKIPVKNRPGALRG